MHILIIYVCVAFVLSIFRLLGYSPIDIAFNTFITLISSLIANFIFAKLFKAITNTESVFITALILVLIFPIKFPHSTLVLIFVSFVAMGSKYLLAIKKRHIFNPAALAALVFGFTNSSASWWIGSYWMLPVVLVGGFLIVRKTRRENLVVNFILLSVLFLIISVLINTGSLERLISTLKTVFLESPLVFFATIMLIEPSSSPSKEKLQKYFAYFVAFLYAVPLFRFLGISLTPEAALCIGNVYTFLMSPMYRLDLYLRTKQVLGKNVFAFLFDKKSNFSFLSGQYMEWTLPHKNTDSRGNRRYFTIASSPTEKALMIAVKHYDPSSSYKKTLVGMKKGQRIIASNLSGDFVLPYDLSKPLIFIAGGIGITPFRSMTQYLVDKNLQANIILFYANRTEEEIAFQDTFQKAQNHGVKTIYLLTDNSKVPSDWKGETGHLTGQMILEKVEDFKERLIYVSGPQLMVQNIEKMLLNLGISSKNIKTDFFPGYAEK